MSVEGPGQPRPGLRRAAAGGGRNFPPPGAVLPPALLAYLTRPAPRHQPPEPEPEPEPDPEPAPEEPEDFAAAVENFRHLPGPPPSPLLVAVVTVLVVLVFWPSTVFGMRGPHHPRGEVIKHTHYRPSPEQHTKLTHDDQLLQDKEHIREDLGKWATEEIVDQMSPDELQFHYFKSHDLDDNVKLDGLELLSAIMHMDHHDVHTHDHEEHDEGLEGKNNADIEAEKPIPLEYYIELIDEVLKEDDSNNDGFLSYAEYVTGRKQNKKRAAELIKAPAPLRELPGMRTK